MVGFGLTADAGQQGQRDDGPVATDHIKSRLFVALWTTRAVLSVA
jgi:hypothetical protein